MTARTTEPMLRPDFEQLLDVYGADRTRWPLAARASAAALLADDQGAREMLGEAAALDAVLAHGSVEPGKGNQAMAALAARIVAAAAATPRLVATSPAPSLAPLVVKQQMTSWRPAAVLAASLVLGVFVGQSQFGAQTLPKLAAVAGISFASPERVALADIELYATDVD